MCRLRQGSLVAYSTLDDLKRRLSEGELVQLTDDHNTGLIDQGLVDSVISEVDRLIDSYLMNQVAVPLSTVPPLIQGVSADLALFRLFLRRGGAVRDEVKELYRQGLQTLVDLARGVKSLAEPGQKAAPRAVRVAAPDAQFNASLLDRY